MNEDGKFEHKIISSADPNDKIELAFFGGQLSLHLEKYASTHLRDVVEAMRQANVGLVMAGIYYEKGLAREAFRCAILASRDFFKAVGAAQEQLAPLLRLEGAIDDLDRGAVDPALRVEKKAGRPQDSAVVWTKRAHLVLALEMEIATGKSVPVACKALEKHIAAQRRRTLSRKSDTQTLESWRKKFQAREIIESVQVIYDTSLSVINDQLVGLGSAERNAQLAKYRDLALQMAGDAIPDHNPLG